MSAIVGKCSRGAILVDPDRFDSPEAVALTPKQFRECFRLMCALNASTTTKKKWRHRTLRMLDKLVGLWGRACAYCGATTDRLEVEHMIPLSRGGADKIENMTVACFACNRRKRTRTVDEFGVFPVARLG